MPAISEQTLQRWSRLALMAFVIALVCFGGSAQFGRFTDIPVRIFAIAALATCVTFGMHRAFRMTRLERAICLLIVAIPLLQLIPLPPFMWQLLGDRQELAEVYRVMGETSLPWLPVNLVPDAGFDGLLFLIIPAAAFLLGRTLDRVERYLVLAMFAAMVIVSMLLGILQELGGENSTLRFYSITSLIGPVGFFANRNHFAVFLAVMIPVGAWLTGQLRDKHIRQRGRAALTGVSILAIVLLLLTQSRSGVLLGLAGSAIALSLFTDIRETSIRRIAVGALLGICALVGIAMVYLEPVVVRFERLREQNARAEIIPQLIDIALGNLPFGSGIGSFASVFPRYESVADLNPAYWNHAHNDILQVAIEAGLPGIILLVLFGIWWVRTLRGGWGGQALVSKIDRDTIRLFAVVSAMLVVHSGFDYPLRTGALAGLFAFLCGVAARLTDPDRRRAGASADRESRSPAVSLARSGGEHVS